MFISAGDGRSSITRTPSGCTDKLPSASFIFSAYCCWFFETITNNVFISDNIAKILCVSNFLKKNITK